MEKIPKFNKLRAFNKVIGPGKKSKLISVGPMFIPDYRVSRSCVESAVIYRLSETPGNQMMGIIWYTINYLLRLEVSI